MRQAGKYAGRATTSGNSRAFRFDAALFRAHPEFTSGPVTAHVIGPGTLLVTTAHEPASEDDDADPLLEAFLAYLEDQARRQPHLIRPLTASDVRGLDELLAGVVVSPDEELDEDFTLP